MYTKYCFTIFTTGDTIAAAISTPLLSLGLLSDVAFLRKSENVNYF
jgi:hypothetical protein